MKTIIVSDVHIKNNNSLIYNNFCNFIDSFKNKKIDNLILLGDIFDILYQSAREEYYYKLYNLLKELYLAGTKIYFLYGNHDFNFKFNKYSFIETTDQLNLKIDKYNALIFHGDGLNHKDFKYFFLKKILRSSFISFIYKIIPEAIFIYLANIFSNLSRKTNIRNDKEIASFYKNLAKEILTNKTCDLLILAHIHIPCIEIFKEGIYLNTGSFTKEGSYLSIIDGLIRIEKFC